MRNKKTQVLFSDKNNRQVVALSGLASVEKSRSKRKELYEKFSHLEIYKEFNDNFGVIRFRAKKLEYLNLDVSNSPYLVLL